EAGPIVWPAPLRFELPADLVDFGYEDEIFLLTELTVPANFQAGTFQVEADARWLECEEICIPSGATVSLSLPVIPQGPAPIDPRWVDGFTATRADQPSDDVTLDSMYSIMDGRINLLVQATEPVFANARDVSFVPAQHRVFDYTASQDIDWQVSSLQMAQTAHRRLEQ